MCVRDCMCVYFRETVCVRVCVRVHLRVTVPLCTLYVCVPVYTNTCVNIYVCVSSVSFSLSLCVYVHIYKCGEDKERRREKGGMDMEVGRGRR